MKQHNVTTLWIIFIIIMLGCGLFPPPPRNNGEGAANSRQDAVIEGTPTIVSDLRLSSPAMQDGGKLPITFTCDGDSLSPPLTWEGAPENTVAYALAMHHTPGPGDTHWYWVIYNIPPDTLSLEAGETNIGTFGINSVNEQQEYAPPCSRGPGEKLYTITVYALSATPNLPNPTSVDRDTLLTAIADITLASASINVTYERD